MSLNGDLRKESNELEWGFVRIQFRAVILMSLNGDLRKKSNELVKVAKQFDALVNALPLAKGGEEAQLKRIAELHDENDLVGQELQRQLQAAEEELKQVQELLKQATDNCLNLKRPE